MEDDIGDVHRKLWPGIKVPATVRAMLHGHKWLWIPTSMVIAMLLWGSTNPKRRGGVVQKSLDSLEELIGFAQIQCKVLKFPSPKAVSRGNVQSQGCFIPLQQRLGPDKAFAPFTESMMNAVLEIWNACVANSNFSFPKECIRESGEVTISDFIAFAIMNYTLDPILQRHKDLLKVTAFSILTQLALHLDSVVLSHLIDYSKRKYDQTQEDAKGGRDDQDPEIKACLHTPKNIQKRKRHRVSSVIVGEIVAKAMALLFDGSDSRLLMWFYLLLVFAGAY